MRVEFHATARKESGQFEGYRQQITIYALNLLFLNNFSIKNTLFESYLPGVIVATSTSHLIFFLNTLCPSFASAAATAAAASNVSVVSAASTASAANAATAAVTTNFVGDGDADGASSSSSLSSSLLSSCFYLLIINE